MQNILNYMIQQYSEVIDLYTKARAAKIKFWHNTNDRFTDDERDSLIMLASAFSAILRRTYRIGRPVLFHCEYSNREIGKNCDFSATTFKGKWFIIYTEGPSVRAAFCIG